MGHVAAQYTAPARLDYSFLAYGSMMCEHVHCSMVEPPVNEGAVHHLRGTNWWSEDATKKGAIARGHELVGVL